jgi:hypothetical protein
MPPGHSPYIRRQELVVFAYAVFACLALNDAVKVAMIRWLVPNAVAGTGRCAGSVKRMTMKIDSTVFRVQEGDSVKLNKYPDEGQD